MGSWVIFAPGKVIFTKIRKKYLIDRSYTCYGNIGKWRSTMFTWPPVVLFIYLQLFTTLPLTVKIVGEIVVPLSLKMQYQITPTVFFFFFFFFFLIIL